MSAPGFLDRLRSAAAYAVAGYNAGKAVVSAAGQVAAAIPPSPPNSASGGILAALPSIQTLEAVTAFLNSSPQAKTLIGLAQNLAAGEGRAFIDAVKAHDWPTVAIDVLTEGLTAAAAFDVPGASFALRLLPAVSWAAHHPAAIDSLAMRKAVGTGDNPWAPRQGGVYETGAI